MNKLSPKTCKTVRLIYGWVFTAYTAVMGILCIWQVLDIYLGGKRAGIAHPFSYELVSYRVSHVLAAPLWIWIAAIVIGIVLWEVFRVEEKLKPVTDSRYVLYRLSKRIPAEVEDDMKSTVRLVREQQSMLRIMHYALLGGAAVLYVIYIVAYVANPSHFTGVDKATSEVMTMALYVLPPAALLYAAGCVYVTFLNRSAKKLLPHVKQLTAGVKAPEAVKKNKITWFFSHKYFILGVRIAVACVGVAFVIAGCFNGSIQEVFEKAIAICTECIGLG